MSRDRRWALPVLPALALVWACAPREVLLVSVDAGGVCQTDQACGEGSYCDRGDTGCDDGPGLCRTRPLIPCPAELSPVCGCDGVTYFNRCLAAAQGTSVAEEGECRDSKRCSSRDSCPTLASEDGSVVCAHFTPRCGPPDRESPGLCFFVPSSCPGSARSCRDAVCLNLCEAIESGETFSLGCP